jgi:hypothetical protein
MIFLEKDLEDIIWETDNEKLQTKGLDISGKKFRQLRIGNYGIADIVTFDKSYFPCHHIRITIYELKKDKIGLSAFLQGINYIKGLMSYFENKRPTLDVSFDLVLCGREIDKSGSFVYLADLFSGEDQLGFLNDIRFYIYDYTADGIVFKRISGYSLKDEGF